jgi:hypothetical protein
MTTMDDQQKKRIEREQGDVNTTPNRKKYWSRNLKGEARQIFEDDKTYFMQQALSTRPSVKLRKASHTDHPL